MLVLTLRTDKPESEIGLYDDDRQLAYEIWPAHRQLAETLHAKIAGLLKSLGKDWQDIQGIIAYQGPGSFTGLRIGLSTANALAAAREIPIVGVTGQDWLVKGCQLLRANENHKKVLPEYGADVHITLPKK